MEIFIAKCVRVCVCVHIYLSLQGGYRRASLWGSQTTDRQTGAHADGQMAGSKES